MTELLTAAQMRAIEQAAIASGEVTGLELMERAGAGVVAAIFGEWPELVDSGRKAVVLCGPGNNGGDGFVVARLLAEREWTVEVFLYGGADKLPPDARVNFERWLPLGAVEDATVEPDRKAQAFDLRVDAVFGSGRKRPPSSALSGAFTRARAVKKEGDLYLQAKRVAVDCPSCLDLDSGKALVPPRIWEGDIHLDFYADLTVSFHRLKVGHMLADGPKYCRKLKVVDIGLEADESEADWYSQDDDDIEEKDRRVVCLEKSAQSGASEKWPSGELSKFEDHKYHHGHALILSGPSGQTGAARLAARGALRIGAGLVTIGCPSDALAEHAAQLTAIMLKSVATPADLTDILTDRRITALCLGPGMGVGALTRAMVAAALTGPAAAPGSLAGGGGPGAGPGLRGAVLDADALTSFEGNPAELFAMTHENTVLTPHGGEFARLFPDIAEKLNAPATKGPAYSKVDATREAAKRAGCVVLFKGPDTVIAAPDGRCSINSAHYERAAPWLATAGSGDVLAGFITGLMARGFAPMQAAKTAAWLHVECARSFGPGLIAEDLPEELPKVFRSLDL